MKIIGYRVICEFKCGEVLHVIGDEHSPIYAQLVRNRLNWDDAMFNAHFYPIKTSLGTTEKPSRAPEQTLVPSPTELYREDKKTPLQPSNDNEGMSVDDFFYDALTMRYLQIGRETQTYTEMVNSHFDDPQWSDKAIEHLMTKGGEVAQFLSMPAISEMIAWVYLTLAAAKVDYGEQYSMVVMSKGDQYDTIICVIGPEGLCVYFAFEDMLNYRMSGGGAREAYLREISKWGH